MRVDVLQIMVAIEKDLKPTYCVHNTDDYHYCFRIYIILKHSASIHNKIWNFSKTFTFDRKMNCLMNKI